MKRAYLTIDDGPSQYRRERVNILKKYGIQAIWFSTGEALRERKDDALYTIEQGGIIGNHSFSHPNFSQISLEQCYNEIKMTDEIIEEIYEMAGVIRPTKVFRFPYGDKGVEKGFYDFNYSAKEKERIDEIQGYLKSLNYEPSPEDTIHYRYFEKLKEMKHLDWYWTYDVMEWCTFQKQPPYGVRTLEDILELMELDLPEQWMGLNNQMSDEIIVIHDHPETIEFFEPSIKGLLEKGIQFHTYHS